MSSTRYAPQGDEQRDERFASSPLLCRPLKMGDVIRRCETLADPRHIELALFIQYFSGLPGGIEKLCEKFFAAFRSRIGTPAMHRFGIKPGGIYGREAVRLIIEGEFFNSEFRTRDGMPVFSATELLDSVEIPSSGREDRPGASAPSQRPVSKFVDECRNHCLSALPGRLRLFCIDPARSVDWLVLDTFQDVLSALIEYMDIWEQECFANLVVTRIGGKVLEALNYSESQRCVALVEGFARTGKTFVAKKWCEARPGKRRFVSLTEARSDKEFFREIALAIGAASSYGLKATELRERVNDILRQGHFALVVDEAHFLWPVQNLRDSIPRRMEWLRTSLANHNVPVVMIATHQFSKVQQLIEKKTTWSSEQLTGRIAFSAKLQDRLEENDIRSVAKYHLPEAEERSIEFLVQYVIASKKYLASIDHGVKAARHQAAKSGRTNVTHSDVIEGFKNTVLPSDQALAAAAGGIIPIAKKNPFNRLAEPTHGICKGDSGTSFSRQILPEPPKARLRSGRPADRAALAGLSTA